jgi:hypothetical protein
VGFIGGFFTETQRKFKERGYKNGQINTAIEKIQNKLRHLFQGQSRKKKQSYVLLNSHSLSKTQRTL